MASIIGVETLQHTNGTTAATIGSGGALTLTKNINQTDLQWWSGFHDTTTVYSAGATISNWTVEDSNGVTEASGVWTISEAGVYLIHISMVIATSGSGIRWKVNSTDKWRIGYGDPTGGTYQTAAGTVMYNFSANDTLEFIAIDGSASFFGAADTNAIGNVTIFKVG